MKIHFLLVKDFFRGGGIETYTRSVGRLLAKRGHEVTVYSTNSDEHRPEAWEGMRIVNLPRIRPYWAEKFGGALMASYLALLNEAPDITHLHSVAAGAMAPLLRLRGATCIIQMHGLEWRRSRWGSVARATLKAMERCSVAYGHALTAVSKTQCDYFTHQYHAQCEYIPTAVDIKPRIPARLILDLGLCPQSYVLFAARLVPEKGAHYLISAFRRLRTETALVIAGDDSSSEAYRRRLKLLAGDDPRIHFIGDVRGQMLEELFSNAALFVQPSELEGLSIGLIEAMSYALPCVASSIPENREVIGEDGLVFRNKDINDLQYVLSAALADRRSALGIGMRARRRVHDRFAWNKVVDQLEDLYCRTLFQTHQAEPGIAEPTRRLAVAEPNTSEERFIGSR